VRAQTLLLFILGTLVWAIALLGLYHVIVAHISHPAENPTAVITYVALLVALAGWMFQSWVSMRNLRKQHTINVLFQTRMGDAWKQNTETIRKLFPDSTPITYAIATRRRNRAAYEAIRFVLNYYEFLAVAVHFGDMDEKVLRECIGTNLCTFCERAEDFISRVREEDASGYAAPEKARLLRFLRRLSQRWQRHIDNERAWIRRRSAIRVWWRGS
jgi:hypothetical protein